MAYVQALKAACVGKVGISEMAVAMGNVEPVFPYGRREDIAKALATEVYTSTGATGATVSVSFFSSARSSAFGSDPRRTNVGLSRGVHFTLHEADVDKVLSSPASGAIGAEAVAAAVARATDLHSDTLSQVLSETGDGTRDGALSLFYRCHLRWAKELAINTRRVSGCSVPWRRRRSCSHGLTQILFVCRSRRSADIPPQAGSCRRDRSGRRT